jgi:hypothetical protein
MILLDPVLVGRVRLRHCNAAMINSNMRRRAHKQAIDVAHEKIAAEKRSNMCLLEQIILAYEFDGDR